MVSSREYLRLPTVVHNNIYNDSSEEIRDPLGTLKTFLVLISTEKALKVIKGSLISSDVLSAFFTSPRDKSGPLVKFDGISANSAEVGASFSRFPM